MIRADIFAETRQRARVYPSLIAKGQISEAESDYQQAIMRAILADVDQMLANAAHDDAVHRFTHAARMTALAREIDYRRRLYPVWLTKGQITQADAQQRQDCLAALLRCYQAGWGWRAANGQRTNFGNDNDAECAANEEFRAYAAAILPILWPHDVQKEMAL